MRNAATFMDALALVLWPALALLVAWRLLPILRERLKHSDVRVALPGTEIKISSPALGREISLEDHAISLKRRSSIFRTELSC